MFTIFFFFTFMRTRVGVAFASLLWTMHVSHQGIFFSLYSPGCSENIFKINNQIDNQIMKPLEFRDETENILQDFIFIKEKIWHLVL